MSRRGSCDDRTVRLAGDGRQSWEGRTEIARAGRIEVIDAGQLNVREFLNRPNMVPAKCACAHHCDA